MAYDRYGYRPYVPQASRRREREREAEQQAKRGTPLAPIAVSGRTIARTFWGKAWCDNLERYSDYANRLPRGRTYLRNGSVFHLAIAPGEVQALVRGSETYRVTVRVSPLPEARWAAICDDAAGAIDSLVELLQGRFSQGVMERLCRPRTGLFPEPVELKLACSCPDGARMCKHVAAALYGVGARLDAQPELLFRLRAVDETALLAQAAAGLSLPDGGPADDLTLVDEDLGALFGLDLGADSALAPEPVAKTKPRKTSARRAAAPPPPPEAPKRSAPRKKAAERAPTDIGPPDAASRPGRDELISAVRDILGLGPLPGTEPADPAPTPKPAARRRKASAPAPAEPARPPKAKAKAKAKAKTRPRRKP